MSRFRQTCFRKSARKRFNLRFLKENLESKYLKPGGCVFHLESKIDGASLDLLLTGEVNINDVARFNDEIRVFSKQPNITQLVLDLSKVRAMDNAGLGALVSLSTSLQRYGRRLLLLAPAPHIVELMQAAEIEGFFPVCETVEEVKEFRPGV